MSPCGGSMTNPNESRSLSDLPAFPMEYHDPIVGTELNTTWYKGLTKREYFAACAMQRLLTQSISRATLEDLSILAIAYADALITELSK